MPDSSDSPSFSKLALRPDLLENLTSLAYLHMTPIQAESLPPILAGRDVIAQAKTGSGKTAAFALGILQKLDVKNFHIQALVICPTRELADQVASEIRRVARSIHNIKVLTLCGGMPFGPQITSLGHGTHIVVGTPGRLEDHLGKGRLKLDKVETLVLDEADRMLDMGFQAVLDVIVEQLPRGRQTLLFSATFAVQIQAASKRVMNNPLMVRVDASHDTDSIVQLFYRVEGEKGRLTALRLLLQKHRPESSLVFCNTRRETRELADALVSDGFSALSLHGDMDQKDRDQTLVQFSNNSASILVATDVAARGLDIAAVDAVFNFHIAHEPEVHVHRVGRTGRAGNKGHAYTFFSEREEYKLELLDVDTGLNSRARLPSQDVLQKSRLQPRYTTLQLGVGKRQKVRPGDILGALTGEKGIQGSSVGKIKVADNWSYVAIETAFAKAAHNKLVSGKLKGRSCRVRFLRH